MEIDCAISSADYFSGACFGRGASSAATPTTSSGFSKQFVHVKPHPMSKSSLSFKPAGASAKKSITLEPVDLISTTAHTANKIDTTKMKTESTYWTAVW
jgi:DNA repair and recombination protein RAD54B